MEEFFKNQKDMADMQTRGEIEVTSDGIIMNKGLNGAEEPLPFTGDHDIFDIRDLEGRPLDPKKYEKVVDKLIEADCGVEHGAATNWKLDSESTFDPKALPRWRPSIPPAERTRWCGSAQVSHTPSGTNRTRCRTARSSTARARQPMDPVLNREHFAKAVASDPQREMALLRNTETGEYLVMQGNRGDVPIWQTGEMVDAVPTQRIGDAGDLKPGGKWVIEAHNHPVDPDTGVTPEYNRFPSGASGDMRAVVRHANATGEKLVSEIHFVGEDGPAVTTFSYDPKTGTFEIDYPRPG